MANGVGQPSGESTSKMLQTEQVEMHAVNLVSRVCEMTQYIIAHPLEHTNHI